MSLSRVKAISLLIPVFLVFFSRAGFADTPAISLTVDPAVASVDDTISMQITVEGKAFSGEPNIEGLSDFTIKGTGSSSQVQIINGSMTSSKVFDYILMPNRAGDFTIGPAILSSGGKEIKSNKATVRILEERSGGAQAPGEQPAYMTATVNNSNPFVGEQIVYTTKFLSRVVIQGAQMEVPSFQGFWREQLGDLKNTQAVIDGQRWNVSEANFALYPLEPGEKTIDKATCIADVVVGRSRGSSFFNNPLFGSMNDTQRSTFRSKPISINVRSLPLEGRPRNFSGLVGSFSITASITSRELEVGDSTTLIVTVSGDGDLQRMEAPKLTNAGDFKIYDDEPKIEMQRGAMGLRQVKTFKKAIVPLKPGSLAIPAFEFSYFDPKTKTYETLSTNRIVLNVKPSSNPEKVVVSSPDGNSIAIGKKVEVLGEDLMPIERSADALDQSNVGSSAIIIYFIVSLIPVVAFIVSLFWYLRLQKVRSDSGFVRRSKALKHAKNYIRKLSKLSDSDFHNGASLVLRNYIGNKLNIDGGSLTPVDVARRLAPSGVAGDTCYEIQKFLNDCDAALYGGMKFDGKNKTDKIRLLTTLIDKLEKELKK